VKHSLWRAGSLLAGLAFGAPAMASQPQLSLPRWSPDPSWDFALTTRAPAPDLAVDADDAALHQRYRDGRGLTRTGVIIAASGYGAALVGSGALWVFVSPLDPSGGGEDIFLKTGVTLSVFGGTAILVGTGTAIVGTARSMSALHLAGADINRRPGHIALGCLGVGVVGAAIGQPAVVGLGQLGFIIFGSWQLVEDKRTGNEYEAMGGFSMRLVPQRVGDTNGLALTGRW